MPIRTFIITRFMALCATALALGGCVSSGEPTMMSMAPGPESAFELALPDSVGAIPELLDRGGEAVADTASNVAEAASTIVAALPDFEPTAFARSDTPVAPRSAELDRLIAVYARHYEVPETLVRRVVKRESNFDPRARNGPYWGLMQIRHDTARGMGYRGPATGLLDAETNLKFAVRYLRGAYMTAEGNHDLAVRFYARGYYYDAKRKGLLDETGLGRDRKRTRRT